MAALRIQMAAPRVQAQNASHNASQTNHNIDSLIGFIMMPIIIVQGVFVVPVILQALLALWLSRVLFLVA